MNLIFLLKHKKKVKIEENRLPFKRSERKKKSNQKSRLLFCYSPKFFLTVLPKLLQLFVQPELDCMQDNLQRFCMSWYLKLPKTKQRLLAKSFSCLKFFTY